MPEWCQIDFDCPVTYTLSVLGGKWKWLIIYVLSEHRLCDMGN